MNHPIVHVLGRIMGWIRELVLFVSEFHIQFLSSLIGSEVMMSNPDR